MEERRRVDPICGLLHSTPRRGRRNKKGVVGGLLIHLVANRPDKTKTTTTTAKRGEESRVEEKGDRANGYIAAQPRVCEAE